MKCAKCQSENRKRVKFREDSGAKWKLSAHPGMYFSPWAKGSAVNKWCVPFLQVSLGKPLYKDLCK